MRNSQKTIFIRGHELREIMNRIEGFIGDYAGSAAAASVSYTVLGRVLFPKRALLHPGNLPRLIYSVLKGRAHFAACTGGFYASSVVVKNNIRINRLNGEPITAKIALPSRHGASLANEIEARQTLANAFAAPGLAPTLLAADRRCGNWLVEEQVEEKQLHIGKAKRLLREVLPRLYGRQPVCRGLCDRDLQYLRLSHNPQVKAILAGKAGATDVVHAFGHGDLTNSNILLARDGRILLCDWEHAGSRPVAFDLAKLYLKNADCRAGLVRLLDDLSTPTCLPGAVQMALGLEDFLNYIRANDGDSLNAKQRARDEKGRDLIAALLSGR